MQSVGALDNSQLEMSRFHQYIFILLPSSSAGDLPGENVECLGCCETTAAVGQSHADGVRGSSPEFSVH